MKETELNLLKKQMQESTNYLEFGAGRSTKMAANLLNIKKIDTVESDKDFVTNNLLDDLDVTQALNEDRLTFHYIDLGPCEKWSYPIDYSKKHLWPNYSLGIFNKKRNYDLVLVDGRFRVSCILNSIINTPDDCKIIAHDFWNRPYYFAALEFLEILEKADTLGLFAKKTNYNKLKIQELIATYQYIPG